MAESFDDIEHDLLYDILTCLCLILVTFSITVVEYLHTCIENSLIGIYSYQARKSIEPYKSWNTIMRNEERKNEEET